MATVKFKGQSVKTDGNLPAIGKEAPEFKLVRGDLSEVALSSLKGRKKILNIFPSLDTSVCSATVMAFEKKAQGMNDTLIVNISKDLPFAQKRFCEAKGIKKTETLSAFRSPFAKDYGVEITEGPLKGLCARAVLVLDEENNVLYRELVPEITQEPAYDKALDVLS